MKTIGRYIIRGLLGRGGMGKVFKVKLPVIGRIAALKLLDPDPLLAKLLGVDRLQTLFVSEAKTMAGLQHPNIVSVQDFDDDNGRPFYVMDFFANNVGIMMGESYAAEKPSRRISVDKALAYTRQTLDGLACLHHAGIIHRDIKPFNLLVTTQDRVKICDFGLSKLRGETFAGPANLNVGSPYYAAPEQEKNPDDVGPTADLYPVGIMLYRMLTGRLPAQGFKTDSDQAPSRLNPDLNEVWDAFIAQAIHPHPPQRFSSAKAMLNALDDLRADWEKQKAQSCVLPVDLPPAPSWSVTRRLHLRATPLKAAPCQALTQFNLDRLWRPATYTVTQFEAKRSGIIVDHATGLIWQQAGSDFPGSWQQARDYIQRLNREQFAGLQNWRLPTINELCSLLRPPPQGQDVCIAPLFDPTQRWLWSADRRSFVAAYYADIELGFIGRQDFDAAYYVRAVCSA